MPGCNCVSTRTGDHAGGCACSACPRAHAADVARLQQHVHGGVVEQRLAMFDTLLLNTEWAVASRWCLRYQHARLPNTADKYHVYARQ
jgi:hypothetical protein